MKKLAYLVATIFGLTLLSCGGSDQPEEVVVEEVVLKGYEVFNLSEWGYALNLMVPKEEIHGKPNVTLTEMGTIKIVVGADFGLEIGYGEADIALLKGDLKENLIFTSEIIKEEENALIYSQTIPNVGVKKQSHFLYKAVIGSEVYEVRDIVDNHYGIGMVEKMLEAAKTIESNLQASK
jgi:hypothetical protein